MVIQLTPQISKQTDKRLIIKAYASWCGHCKVMKPLFEQLEKEVGSQYTFAEFDIDQSPELAEQLGINSIPVFIVMKNGKETGRELGEISYDKLKEFAQNAVK